MKKPLKDFMDELYESSKKANSEITTAAFRNCKNWGNSDCFIILVKPNADKFEVIKNFIETLANEDD